MGHILIYQCKLLPYTLQSNATELTLRNAFFLNLGNDILNDERSFLQESGRRILLKSTWTLKFLGYEGVKGQI